MVVTVLDRGSVGGRVGYDREEAARGEVKGCEEVDRRGGHLGGMCVSRDPVSSFFLLRVC
jgi:hypothetical protein